jgi:hypothetical protein
LKGATAKPPGLTIEVLRPEEEVFSSETIASFEGMPVTNNHPPDGVDIDNIRRLPRGGRRPGGKALRLRHRGI